MIRLATPHDAPAIARVHVETWRDTYAGIIPDHTLLGLDEQREAVRQRQALGLKRDRAITMVAEVPNHGVIGYAEAGAPRAAGLAFDAELYTIYVQPGFQGEGHGRALLGAAFTQLRQAGFCAAIVWVLAENPARFFYAAMGARQIGVRTERLFGVDLAQEAYGWPQLEGAMQLSGRLSRRI
ncbi:MAG: GNAT family N-acetyltransferase [Alphaproteobacteria bacterium]|nr:GNAT family N-acetyltransferase [Alphaproteobacteria bacterium]